MKLETLVVQVIPSELEKHKDPVKLIFPVVKPEQLIVPALIFVSTKFVVVTFTVVNVPATDKLPLKLKFPPVIVVAASIVYNIFSYMI